MNTTDNERVAGVVLLLIIGGAILPTLIPTLGASASSWLVEHQVLVDPDHAVVSIPGLGAGLDARRLVVAVLLLVAVMIFGAASRRGVRGRR